jgi:hypothetical protein
MSATTSTDYTLVSSVIDGYGNAYFPEKLGFVKAGLVLEDKNPKFARDGGNTHTLRKRVYTNQTWRAPSSDTDTTIDSITSSNEIGVIIRRYVDLGIEDFAIMAAGDYDAMEDYGRILAHNAALNMEKSYATNILPALFNPTNGALYSSHCHDISGATIKNEDIVTCEGKLGENQMMITDIMMHSTVFNNTEIRTLTDPAVDQYAIETFQSMGLVYAGNLAGKRIILNDRCISETASIYNTYLFKKQALYLGFQKPLTIEVFEDKRLAAGTNVCRYTVACSPHVFGVSFSGTAPTAICGATDAALLTATNWTKRTGVTDSEIGVLCIRSMG